jgi:hypothetical protein
VSNLWRCLNPDCAAPGGPAVFDYEAAGGACPKCGTTPAAAPNAVVERACIHYLVNDPRGPIRLPHGGRQVACLPLLARLPRYATGERVAVTCPACRATAVFAGHAAAGVDQHTAIVPGVPSGPTG